MKRLLKITTDEHGWTQMDGGEHAYATYAPEFFRVSERDGKRLGHRFKLWNLIPTSVHPRVVVSLSNHSSVVKTNFLFALSILFIILLSSCSNPFPKGSLIDLMPLYKLLPSTTTTPTTTTPTVSTNKYIFLTAAHNGNFGGISGVDSYCQSQKTASFSSLPGDATEYKAFLATNSNVRRACSTSDCSGGISENIDWVLKANTDYYRLDGTTDTKIFTTNSSGIVNFTGGATLLTAIDASGTTFWWTGLDVDWLAPLNGDCNAWNGTIGVQGYRGVGASTSVTAISYTTLGSCNSNTMQKLLCVRQ